MNFIYWSIYFRSMFLWERKNKEALSYKVDSSKQTRAILVNMEKDNSM